jgi:biopolymer transport protein ExbD
VPTARHDKTWWPRRSLPSTFRSTCRHRPPTRSRGRDRPLYLTVKSDLTLALGDDSVSRDLLPGTLDAAAKGDKDTRIFLRADKAVPYGEVMEVMNLLRAAGYLKVALVGLEKAPGP